MKYLKKFNDDKEDFGIINIHIDGDHKHKKMIIDDIKDTLKGHLGETNLFIDGKKIMAFNQYFVSVYLLLTIIFNVKFISQYFEEDINAWYS
jgi:hypothetical protein